MTGHFASTDLGLYIFAAAAIAVALSLLVRQRRGRARIRRASGGGAAVSELGRRQVAAVPVRIGPQGTLEVLVVSTRGSGRWTVPKGWPMRGHTDAEAAAREAYEEAGVRGSIGCEPLGTFEYRKRRNEDEILLVTVYRLDVSEQLRSWRERGQRKQRWLPASAAADCVAWNGLAEIIRSLEMSRAV
jgi:8-oxo-dGTP pyrophosphatase MutT (NUDIX family)